jgi:leucyl aminopeptidase
MKINFVARLNDVPLVIVPIFKNAATLALLDRLAVDFKQTPFLLKKDFNAEAKECLLLYPEQGSDRKVFLLGLGAEPSLGDVLAIFRYFAFTQRARLTRDVVLDWRVSTIGAASTTYLTAAVNGLCLGGYQVGVHKTDSMFNIHPFKNEAAMLTICAQHPYLQLVAQKGVETAETQMRLMDLVNSPSNFKQPRVLGEWAEASGKQFGYKTTIFDKKKCIEKGLHALLSVNQGSPEEPRFIIMEYLPTGITNKKLTKIGLVGKGVTFDTGGISIKSSTNMHKMKSDMGGAAAVLGTIELAARLQLPVHLIGIIPSTENMVDGKATKPGDVVGSYLGKTIEVIDTDAEGRIILADGLSYMVKNYNPDTLIDLATLTGSVIGTLGYHCAGLFTNDDALAARLTLAGELTGEKVWRLPLWDAYAEDLKSDIADLSNFSGKPMAGAISAAKFLEVFTDKHPHWAHLDIAGMAFSATELSPQQSATAYGIRLLMAYIELLINDL